jgi:hypothetical protein
MKTVNKDENYWRALHSKLSQVMLPDLYSGDQLECQQNIDYSVRDCLKFSSVPQSKFWDNI